MSSNENDKAKQRRVRKLKFDDVWAAIIDAKGILTVAAKKCNVTHSAMWQYVKNNPELNKAIEIATEEVLDLTELKFFEALRSGDPWAVKFMLATKGKRRGYSNDVAINGNIEVNIDDVKSKIISRIVGRVATGGDDSSA